MNSRSDLSVPEDPVLDACGEYELPEFGLIEQVWETDPVPVDDIPPERATPSNRSRSTTPPTAARWPSASGAAVSRTFRDWSGAW
jgi:hypothetical protein